MTNAYSHSRSPNEIGACSIEHLLLEILFEETMNIDVQQQKFLSNDQNKKRFISFLGRKLQEDGFSVKHAQEDADVLIVNTAIELARINPCQNVYIIGEDTDILVLMTQIGHPIQLNNLYFKIPSKNNIPERLYNMNSFKFHCKDLVAFMHAFCGCDTTSAFYQIGKNKIVSLIENSQELQALARAFNNVSNSSTIAENTNKIIRALYGNKNTTISICDFRYGMFKRLAAKKSFKLEKLPPTEAVAKLHGYRVYHQIQTWLGTYLPPTEWGWRSTCNGLQPMHSLEDLIPSTLLETIFCRCEKGCRTVTCTCRKHGLRCSDICLICRGNSCFNTEFVETLDNAYDETDNV